MKSTIIGMMSHNETTISSLLPEDIHNDTHTYEGLEIEDYGRNLTETTTKAVTCDPKVYFICPDPNPLFNTCAAIKLTADLQVCTQPFRNYLNQ